MSLAAETREAVRARPFLFDALRAGVVNHSAAAGWLTAEADLDGDADAIATALRRFREDLPAYATAERSASVSMRSGVGVIEEFEEAEESGEAEEFEESGEAEGKEGDPLLRVAGATVVPEGDATAVIATGDVNAATLAETLDRLRAADVVPVAAGVAGSSLLVVVGRREGATAVRVVEDALAASPELR